MAEVPAVAAIAEGSDRHGRFALLNGTGLLGLYVPDQRFLTPVAGNHTGETVLPGVRGVELADVTLQK
jgi:hypothetical protein